MIRWGNVFTRHSHACFGLFLGLSLLLGVQAEVRAEKAHPRHTSEPQKNSLMTLVPSLTPISDYRGDLSNRAALFGDVGGWRQKLYEKGVALDFELTQVPQGVVSGGRSKEWDYAGTSDYYLFLDSGRLNLWPEGLVGIHAESKFGASTIGKSGAISPVNADFLWPEPGNDDLTFLSEYYLYQGLTDWLTVVAGRLNWVGVADKSHFANDHRTQFLNMALRNTLLLGALFPLTAHGGALIIQPSQEIAITPYIVSQNDQPGTYGSPGGLFSEITAGVELNLTWKFMDLPGIIRPSFSYGTKDPVALDNQHLVGDAISGLSIPKKDANWLVNFNLDQYFYMPQHQSEAKQHTASFDNNPEGIGLFFRFAYTPEDRNPWNIFVSGGVGGRGVIPTRPNDRYGVGVYSLTVSDDLQSQAVLGRLESEWGLEAFYNIAITPWLQFTPDIQYIQPGVPGGVDDVLMLATRIQMYF